MQKHNYCVVIALQLERKSTPFESQIHRFFNAPHLLSESNKNPLQNQVERDCLAHKCLLAHYNL